MKLLLPVKEIIIPLLCLLSVIKLNVFTLWLDTWTYFDILILQELCRQDVHICDNIWEFLLFGTCTRTSSSVELLLNGSDCCNYIITFFKQKEKGVLSWKYGKVKGQPVSTRTYEASLITCTLCLVAAIAVMTSGDQNVAIAQRHLTPAYSHGPSSERSCSFKSYVALAILFVMWIVLDAALYWLKSTDLIYIFSYFLA